MFFRYSVTPPHPTAKPSWGWLRVGVRKPRLVLAEFSATWNKGTATPRPYWRGCKETAVLRFTYHTSLLFNNCHDNERQRTTKQIVSHCPCAICKSDPHQFTTTAPLSGAAPAHGERLSFGGVINRATHHHPQRLAGGACVQHGAWFAGSSLPEMMLATDR